MLHLLSTVRMLGIWHTYNAAQFPASLYQVSFPRFGAEISEENETLSILLEHSLPALPPPPRATFAAEMLDEKALFL